MKKLHSSEDTIERENTSQRVGEYFFKGFISKVKVKVTQSYLTICDPMDYTVHGFVQPRIQEWVAFPFSRGSSQPREWTQVSHIAGIWAASHIWATRETQEYWSGLPIPSPADLKDPGMKPDSPALQVDSLPTELSGRSSYPKIQL